MTVVFVAGARPNFVKIAPLLRAFHGAAELVHTGQHHDRVMAGVFFDELGIRAADHDLGIRGAQTAQIMDAFRAHLARRRPRGVVVVGDVASTMACALAAADLGIPVAHVEAGLRSFDRSMPEEIHRIVTDAVAELLFASEPAAIANLANEGRRNAHLVGNVMIDTLVAQLPAARALHMPERMEVSDYVLATLHRPSNVDDPARLATLLQLLVELADDRDVVFPVHPRTRARLAELPAHPRLHLVEPLGYREFLGAMDAARCVISDSGGIQEETTYLGVPCFTLRTTTERPITVERGTNELVQDLSSLAVRVRDAVRSPAPAIAGWDGHAAERIAEILTRTWAS